MREIDLPKAPVPTRTAAPGLETGQPCSAIVPALPDEAIPALFHQITPAMERNIVRAKLQAILAPIRRPATNSTHPTAHPARGVALRPAAFLSSGVHNPRAHEELRWRMPGSGRGHAPANRSSAGPLPRLPFGVAPPRFAPLRLENPARPRRSEIPDATLAPAARPTSSTGRAAIVDAAKLPEAGAQVGTPDLPAATAPPRTVPGILHKNWVTSRSRRPRFCALRRRMSSVLSGTGSQTERKIERIFRRLRLF